MSKQVNVHEAKTHLSKLLAEVQRGADIIIAKAGKPIARLSPSTDRPLHRTPGSAKGTIVISPDFTAPLPEDFLNAFG